MVKLEQCKICGKSKANVPHLKKAHKISWEEYTEALKDDTLMQKLREMDTEEERAEKAIRNALINRWFQAPMLVSLIHAHSAPSTKGAGIDISNFRTKTEAEVSNLRIAEALSKEGWRCIMVVAGRPKRYVMKKE